MHKDQAVIIENNSDKNKHLITNLLKNNVGKTATRKYSIELRKFALTLNFCSPEANIFVRNEFDLILSSRTLSKWYMLVNTKPGLIVESTNALTIVFKNLPNPLYCTLTTVVISIRKHIDVIIG